MVKNKETIKTIAITILVTAQIAFIGGMVYNQKQNDFVKTEVQEQVQQLKAELQKSEQ